MRRVKRLIAFSAACSLLPAAALAQPGFAPGGPPVRGLSLEVENQPVLNQPDLFTSERVCGAFLPADGNLAGIADLFVSRATPLIRQRVSGFDLVRYHLQGSSVCDVSAYLDRDGVVVTIRLPGNVFETNVTTPDLHLLGGQFGLPQGTDPRLRVSFDAEVETRIVLPTSPGGCIETGSYRGRVSNISFPQGVNFTGRAAGALLDVLTSIYDVFNDREIGRWLAEGISRDGRLPAELINVVNQPLCRSGQSFGALANSMRGDQLVLALARGGTIVDDRCISGYVWRQLRPDDRVCVTPAVRDQIFEDNRLSPSRTEPVVANADWCRRGQLCPVPPRGTSPARCRSGFVWRTAVADDYACVLPEARAQAEADNRAAPTRRRDYQEVIR